MSDQKIGEGYDLDSIAVAVLGGAAIGGGSGSVGGTVLAAVIILVLTNLSLLMGFPIQSQMVIKGLVIVLALWLTARRKVRYEDPVVNGNATRRRGGIEDMRKFIRFALTVSLLAGVGLAAVRGGKRWRRPARRRTAS